MVIRSRPRVNTHSRSLPGIAWCSSIAQASSTAMRKSSISSSVKSRRAASPAVAVRSTDRYAPSAGNRTVTWSGAVSRPAGTAREAAVAAVVVVFSVTSVLPHPPDACLRGAVSGSCLQPTVTRRLHSTPARWIARSGPQPEPAGRAPGHARRPGGRDRGASALLGLPEDLADLLDLAEQLVGHARVHAALGARGAGELGRLVEQRVQLRVLLKVRCLEVVGPQHPQVVLDQFRPLLLDDQRPGPELRVGVRLVLLGDGLDRLRLDPCLGGVIDAAREVAVRMHDGARLQETCEQPHGSPSLMSDH